MIDFIKDADCTKETPVRLGVENRQKDIPVHCVQKDPGGKKTAEHEHEGIFGRLQNFRGCQERV